MPAGDPELDTSLPTSNNVDAEVEEMHQPGSAVGANSTGSAPPQVPVDAIKFLYDCIANLPEPQRSIMLQQYVPQKLTVHSPIVGIERPPPPPYQNPGPVESHSPQQLVHMDSRSPQEAAGTRTSSHMNMHSAVKALDPVNGRRPGQERWEQRLIDQKVAKHMGKLEGKLPPDIDMSHFAKPGAKFKMHRKDSILSSPTGTGEYPRCPSPKPENRNKNTGNILSDIDQLQHEKRSENTQQLYPLPYKPAPFLVSEPIDSRFWRQVQYTVVYYTDAEWIKYTTCHGEDASFEDFLQGCSGWTPDSRYGPQGRFQYDHQTLIRSLSWTDTELAVPTLLHLAVGQSKWNLKLSGEQRPVVAVGEINFSTLEQVEIAFRNRTGLVKYLMRNCKQLYSDPDNWRDPVADAPLRLTLAKAPRYRSNSPRVHPFLQLFVCMDPEESARQLELGLPPEENGDTTTLSSKIHELLPLICAPNAVGLECMVKLIPKLSLKCISSKDKDGNTLLHLVARYMYVCDEANASKPQLLDIIKVLVDKYPGAVREINNAAESPFLTRIKTYKQRNPNHVDSERLVNAPEDDITFYLKQLCIRLYSPEITRQLLYSPKDARRELEPNFQLILSGGSYKEKKVSRAQVETLLNTLGNVLKSVEIVPFTIIDENPPSKDPVTDNPSTDSPNVVGYEGPKMPPNNCEIVFSCLKQRGVRIIYELFVEEENICSPNIPPHTNDAILRCLTEPHVLPGNSIEPFSEHIATWDWQKIDICSEALYKAAPNASKVYLYTSGNNAVLRSWSSADGLVKLSKLQDIYLIVCKAHVVETTASIRAALEDFETRIAALCSGGLSHSSDSIPPQSQYREINIHVDDECLEELDVQTQKLQNPAEEYSSSDMDRADASQIMDLPAWQKKMKAFTNFIINCPDTISPIKVAVLDDGFDLVDGTVDPSADIINDRNSIVFKTVELPPESGSGDSSYSPPLHSRRSKFSHRQHRPQTRASYISETGHGTKMVKIIMGLCPTAKLFVARLNSTSRDSRGPTTASAAEAIKWAIKNEVDIISMSWTIQMSPSSVTQLHADEIRLKDAVRQARDANILMFGASADQGNNGPAEHLIYPAAAPGVFCIIAADTYGQLKHTVGAERLGQYTYAFPSEETKDAPDKGSSVATAMAAGFTALLLHAAELGRDQIGAPDKGDVKALRNYQNMAKVLEELLVPGTKYIGATRYIPDSVCQGDWDSKGRNALRFLMLKLIMKGL